MNQTPSDLVTRAINLLHVVFFLDNIHTLHYILAPASMKMETNKDAPSTFAPPTRCPNESGTESPIFSDRNPDSATQGSKGAEGHGEPEEIDAVHWIAQGKQDEMEDSGGVQSGKPASTSPARQGSSSSIPSRRPNTMNLEANKRQAPKKERKDHTNEPVPRIGPNLPATAPRVFEWLDSTESNFALLFDHTQDDNNSEYSGDGDNTNNNYRYHSGHMDDETHSPRAATLTPSPTLLAHDAFQPEYKMTHTLQNWQTEERTFKRTLTAFSCDSSGKKLTKFVSGTAGKSLQRVHMPFSAFRYEVQRYCSRYVDGYDLSNVFTRYQAPALTVAAATTAAAPAATTAAAPAATTAAAPAATTAAAPAVSAAPDDHSLHDSYNDDDDQSSPGSCGCSEGLSCALAGSSSRKEIYRKRRRASIIPTPTLSPLDGPTELDSNRDEAWKQWIMTPPLTPLKRPELMPLWTRLVRRSPSPDKGKGKRPQGLLPRSENYQSKTTGNNAKLAPVADLLAEQQDVFLSPRAVKEQKKGLSWFHLPNLDLDGSGFDPFNDKQEAPHLTRSSSSATVDEYVPTKSSTTPRTHTSTTASTPQLRPAQPVPTVTIEQEAVIAEAVHMATVALRELRCTLELVGRGCCESWEEKTKRKACMLSERSMSNRDDLITATISVLEEQTAAIAAVLDGRPVVDQCGAKEISDHHHHRHHGGHHGKGNHVDGNRITYVVSKPYSGQLVTIFPQSSKQFIDHPDSYPQFSPLFSSFPTTMIYGQNEALASQRAVMERALQAMFAGLNVREEQQRQTQARLPQHPHRYQSPDPYDAAPAPAPASTWPAPDDGQGRSKPALQRLQDYQMQLMLLEQPNWKRLMQDPQHPDYVYGQVWDARLDEYQRLLMQLEQEKEELSRELEELELRVQQEQAHPQHHSHCFYGPALAPGNGQGQSNHRALQECQRQFTLLTQLYRHAQDQLGKLLLWRAP
ncbi:hypothetical protein B0H66DRAFT_629521 [Apodospora peruviana]|uniref:Uncharacterized protein n=1 Tax=Apodospora peruviana TaxID=516989 RepID=A0AAE0HVB0_9PEZI|nr:hypothetical protein B0H66DRAFT_629521 [Apodospora peruviana]